MSDAAEAINPDPFTPPAQQAPAADFLPGGDGWQPVAQETPPADGWGGPDEQPARLWSPLDEVAPPSDTPDARQDRPALSVEAPSNLDWLEDREKLKALFTRVAEELADQILADRTAVVHINEEGYLSIGGQAGFGRFALYHNSPVSLTVLEDSGLRGRTTLSFDARDDHETQQTLTLMLSNAVSLICVPFFDASGKAIGALYGDTVERERAFRHNELRYARELATWVSARLAGKEDLPLPLHQRDKRRTKKLKAAPPAEKPRPAPPPHSATTAGTPGIQSARVTVRIQDLAIFAQQFSMMLAQGIGMVSALDIAAQGSPPELSEVLQMVQRKVEEGTTLSKAMEAYPQTFGQLFVLMVRVGEETGEMPFMFAALGETLLRADQVRRRTLQALVYPAFVLGSSALMVLFLVTYMLPGFVGMFAQQGKELPTLTRVVLGVFTNPFVRLGLPLLVLLPFLLRFAADRSPGLAGKIRAAAYRMPLLGGFMTRFALLNSVRSLALLQRGGVDIRRALRTLDYARTGSDAIDTGFKAVEAGITEGMGLAEAFASQPVFPVLLVSLVEVGEETGEVGHLLQRYVAISEEALSGEIETILSVLEPLMMGVLGIVVGVIVLAAFLPTYQLVVQM